MYHNVVEPGQVSPQLSPSVTSYFVTPRNFEQHLKLVKQVGSRGLSFQDLTELLAASSKRGQTSLSLDEHSARPCAVYLTFDDGWRGSVETAGPLLEQFGLSAHLFVTTGLIGSKDFVNERLLASLDTRLFHVGSHAHTHRPLSLLSRTQVEEELRRSKQQLEEICAREVVSLSVPGGAVSPVVFELARQVGFRYVFTSRVGLNMVGRTDTHDIARVAVKANTPLETVRRWLQGDLRPELRKQQWKQWLRRLLGERTYRKLRRRLLGEQTGQLEMVDLAACNSPVDDHSLAE